MRNSLIFLLHLLFFSTLKANALSCLPTCSEDDDRFLTVPGEGLSTIAGIQTLANFIATGDNLEFGIFDGDATLLWDRFNGDLNRVQLSFQLFADPDGDGIGVGAALATWTSDGSSGSNDGVPMPNNDWFDIEFPNDPSAMDANGTYTYTLRAIRLNPPNNSASNSFKLRTNDIIYIPAMHPISFTSQIFSAENTAVLVEGFMTIYPDLFCTNNDPLCAQGYCNIEPPGTICDRDDPTCCFHETTYDGTWRFFMNVPSGLTQLDIWDGDFDVGNADGTTMDTDDPNTPGDPFLPPWAAGTSAIFEVNQPAGSPPDDIDNQFIVRVPDIQYTVFDPLGNEYVNDNASGDREWELFALSTLTDDPTVADLQVPSIPEGLWEVRLMGVDIDNLNTIVLPFDLFGVDEEGEPPSDPTPVPALGEWGLIYLAVIVLFISIFHLNRRRVLARS